MKLGKFAVPALAALMASGCVVGESDTVGNEQLEHMHEGCVAEAIMETGDFNGNGVIDSGDLEMISAYNEAGDYAAFFDMNADGALDGQDIAQVAKRIGSAGSARDAQMAALFAATEPFRFDQGAAFAAGYVPFTPNLMGHGIHWANFDLIYSWGARGFVPGQPEGLNYDANGTLMAAFYYAPGAIDLYDYGQYPEPDTAFQELPPPHPTFAGGEMHDWHQHIGPCFGGATCPVLGFDQCVRERTCYDDFGASLWSPRFHMIHVWLYEFNECGPFAGLDAQAGMGAPHEPNHGACQLADIVDIVDGPHHDPLGFEANACYCAWPYGPGDATCE
jgi:hypothetical protein